MVSTWDTYIFYTLENMDVLILYRIEIMDLSVFSFFVLDQKHLGWGYAHSF